MARILKNKLFLLIFATLCLLVTIGISSREGSKLSYATNVFSVVISPVENFFSYIGDKVGESFSYFGDVDVVKKENEQLKAKVDKLEQENKELKDLRKKNDELRQSLNIKKQFSDFEPMGGNIIAKDMGNWFNVFTVDRGKKDGVSAYQPVITSKGLVGIVVSSDVFSAKVLSIIDQDSSVSAILTKSRELVAVKGDLTLKDQGLCKMVYVPDNVDISVGDTVETSGMGGNLPKGIVIGKIKEVRRASSELSRYAVIEPSVDFKRLEEVFILKNKNKIVEMDSGTK